MLDVRDLFREAYTLYTDRQLDPALERYMQTLNLAQEQNEQSIVAECTEMIGVILYQTGRLTDTVAHMSRLQGLTSRQVPTWPLFSAMIHLIQAAQRLPVRLSAIERVYQDAEVFLASRGVAHWRHELLIHRARLEWLRGRYEEALTLAQEAIALKSLDREDANGRTQVWDYHFHCVVDICLSASRYNQAEDYLDRWERQFDEMPQNRAVRMATCRAALALASQRFTEALRWSERAERGAQETAYFEVLVPAYDVRLVACLACSELDGALAVLRRFAQHRKSESQLDRYLFFRAVGDYQRVAAIASHRGRSIRAWHRARMIAATADSKLECAIRTDEIRERLSQ